MESAALLDLVNPEERNKTIYIRMEKKTKSEFERYVNFSKKYSGDMEAVLYFEDLKEYVKTPDNMRLKLNDNTIEALKKEFGDKNIIIK